MKYFPTILSALMMGLTLRVAAEPAPAPPKFIIGVWYQPVENFQKWKDRGINTLVGYTPNVPRDQWTRAARDAGLYYIIKPTEDPADLKTDFADPFLLGWEQPDEPDGAGNTPPAKIIENYKNWKINGGDKPVLLNLDGWRTQYGNADDYFQYCQGADWIAFDYYIINRGEGPENIKKIGERIDKLKEWTLGQKKIFVFIECSDQNLKASEWGKQVDPDGTRMRCPTPDEMNQEIDVAMQHGASGIIYFPDIIGRGWEAFDGTPAPVEAAMKKTNAKLTTDAAKSKPANAPAAPRASLDGQDITIGGVTYTLKLKNDN